MSYPKRFGFLVVLSLLVVVAGAGCSKKARAARIIRSADADFAADHYQAAEIEYKNALRYGLDAHAIGRLGVLYSRDGRMQVAFAYLRKSDELAPKDPMVKGALGVVYASFRDLRDGFRLAKETLALQPTNGQALMLLSETVPSMDDLPKARSFLGALPSQAHALPEYYIALATLDLASHDGAAAEAEMREALAHDPNSCEAHYRLSQLYFQRTNLVAATNELKAAAASAPWRSPIRLKAIEMETQSGNIDAPRKSLEEISAHVPDFVPARSALMRLDFSSKRYDDCKKDIVAVLENDPDNYDAMLEMGLVAMAQGHPDEAIAAFQQLELRRPKVPDVKYYLGLASMTRGEQAKARQYLAEAVDLNTNYVQAILLLAQLDVRTQNASAAAQRLEKLVRQQPSLLEPRLLLAGVYSIEQQPQRALAIYRQLCDMLPEDPRMPYFVGLILSQTGDFPGAADAFKKSLRLAPDSAVVLGRLVEVDIALKHFDAALRAVQLRIDSGTNAAHWRLLQAHVYRAQHQDQAAEDALNKAIATDAGLVQAYVALADLYLAEHKEQQALDKLNSIVARTNDASALMALGVIEEKLTHFEAARDAYEKSLAVNPKFSPALNNLAYLYSENLGQLDKALVYAQKAHDLRPNDPSSADTLGWVLFQRGDYPRALTLLQEGADGEPGDPEIQFHIGMLHYKLGEEDQARLALQNAAASLSAFTGKDQARQCLEILMLDPLSANDQTVASLEKIIQSDPHDLPALKRLGEIDEHRGIYDKAAQRYEEALKASPKSAELMARLAAVDADHLNRPDVATELARKAHDLDGENSLACAVLGRLNYAHGDFPTALALLQKAASDRANAQTFSDLAFANYAMGRVEDAVTAMQTAVNKSPSGIARDADQLFLALIAATDSPAVAQAALPRAKAALQSNGKLLPALMVCGLAADAAGDYKGAENYFDQIIAISARCSPALRQSAILLAARLGDDEKAYDRAEKARAAFPRDPEIAKILGQGAYRHGNFALSSQILQESPSHNTDSEALYYLGMDYYKLNRNAESKRTLQKALALNLPAPLAADAKRVLGELK